MLKKRIIATLTLKDGVLFRSRNFEPDYRYTHNFIDLWSIDEVVILDITRNLNFDSQEKKNFFDILQFISKNIVVPLTVGGGIRNEIHIKKLLDNGADKITINSIATEDPKIIGSFAYKYGKQCIVISIDVKKIGNNYIVFSNFGKKKTKYKIEDWIKIVQEEGAGEILIQSIDYDTLEGYNYELVEKILKLSLPLMCQAAQVMGHFAKYLIITLYLPLQQPIYIFTKLV